MSEGGLYFGILMVAGGGCILLQRPSKGKLFLVEKVTETEGKMLLSGVIFKRAFKELGQSRGEGKYGAQQTAPLST